MPADRPVAVGPDDWRAWRALRLQALQDAPRAFTRTYAEAAGWPEQRWRDLLARPGGCWLVPGSPSPSPSPSAMAAAFPDDGRAWLGAVYVVPAARGRGLLDALVADACAWAAAQGHDRLLLEVHEDNLRARAAYRRLGFTDTGARTPHPSGDGDELEMSLALPDGPTADPGIG